MNFDLGHFTFFYNLYSLFVIYPRERSISIKNTKKVFLSLSALCWSDPWGRS